MPTLEQLQKELTDLKTLVFKAIRPDGSLILPEMDAQQRTAFQQEIADAIPTEGVKKAVLSLVPTGNGATTSPVGGGSPVEPAPTVPAGSLLDASWLTKFDLKGRESKRQLIDVVKGDKFTVVVDVKSTNGGGVGTNLVLPDNNKGVAKYQKLEKLGKNTVHLTAEVTGKVYFEVAANNSDTTILSVNLTKTV